MKVPCFCIDDRNRPLQIPAKDWVKLEEAYHVTHITLHPNQGNIQGCSLYEKPLTNCQPFEYFKLSRFAFRLEDLPSLIELIQESANLDKVDIMGLLKEAGVQIREKQDA